MTPVPVTTQKPGPLFHYPLSHIPPKKVKTQPIPIISAGTPLLRSILNQSLT